MRRAIRGICGVFVVGAFCTAQVARAETIAFTASLDGAQADNCVDGGTGSAGTGSKKKKTLSKTNHVQALENELRQRLGTKVVIQSKTKNQGTFIIHFGSNDDFERILEVLRS